MKLSPQDAKCPGRSLPQLAPVIVINLLAAYLICVNFPLQWGGGAYGDCIGRMPFDPSPAINQGSLILCLCTALAFATLTYAIDVALFEFRHGRFSLSQSRYDAYRLMPLSLCVFVLFHTSGAVSPILVHVEILFENTAMCTR